MAWAGLAWAAMAAARRGRGRFRRGLRVRAPVVWAALVPERGARRRAPVAPPPRAARRPVLRPRAVRLLQAARVLPAPVVVRLIAIRSILAPYVPLPSIVFLNPTATPPAKGLSGRAAPTALVWTRPIAKQRSTALIQAIFLRARAASHGAPQPRNAQPARHASSCRRMFMSTASNTAFVLTASAAAKTSALSPQTVSMSFPLRPRLRPFHHAQWACAGASRLPRIAPPNVLRRAPYIATRAL